VTVVKNGGPGIDVDGKWVDEPFTSLWPRKYSATCFRMVDVLGPLSCCTAVFICDMMINYILIG